MNLFLVIKSTTMAETRKIILGYLPDVLVDLVFDYFMAKKRDGYHMAKAGEWENIAEEGKKINECYRLLDGSAEGDHLEQYIFIYSILVNNGIYYRAQGYAASSRSIRILQYIIDNEKKICWDTIQRAAFYKGRVEVLELIKKYGPINWKHALYIICKKSKNVEMINYAIANGANDFNLGLTSACESNHKNIAHIMIKHGANSCGCKLQHIHRPL